ncbi:MAG: hypothetical protein H0U13_15220 [Gemmatimonadaceae bacterium]|nr:hypothetical protein [Gemmatimonadaceae bacterium]
MTMHTRLWIAALLAATPILALSPVAFPGERNPGCVRPDPSSRYNLRLFTSLMRRKDDNARATLVTYSVPRVSARDVQAVTEPVLCARASVAYGKALRDETPGRRVHILRVGNRFIVMDPEYKVDQYHRAVTFDSTFSKALAVIAE